MEFLTLSFFTVILLAVLMESIDSSLGMMYGTILSPLLIGLGFSPLDVVPSLVLSQAVGGIFASIRHHKYKNAVFNCKSKDTKVAVVIFSLGIIAVIAGALLGIKINKFALSLYIAILMLLMGVFVLIGFKLKFKWNRIYFLGLISSFNKALSGGGFGPIVTSGQLISGRSGRRSVGATTLSEVEICLASFIVWLVIGKQFPSLSLLVALSIGAIIGGFIGPYLLSKIKNTKILTKLVGILAIASGIFALIKIL